MFYKFNSIVGRISQAKFTEAYTPQGFSPKVETTPYFMFDSSTTKASNSGAPGAVAGKAHTGPVIGSTPSAVNYRRMQGYQSSMAASEGALMVWQKFHMDKGAYMLSIGLTAAVLTLTGVMFWGMIFPKKRT